jgi:hypothetical protein
VRYGFLYRVLGVVVRSGLRRHQVAGAIRAVLPPVVPHIPDNLLWIFSGLELADRVAPVALGLALFARCPPGRGGRGGRGALWVFTPDRKVLRPVRLPASSRPTIALPGTDRVPQGTGSALRLG